MIRLNGDGMKANTIWNHSSLAPTNRIIIIWFKYYTVVCRNNDAAGRVLPVTLQLFGMWQSNVENQPFFLSMIGEVQGIASTGEQGKSVIVEA